jgi:hypothetical protein
MKLLLNWGRRIYFKILGSGIERFHRSQPVTPGIGHILSPRAWWNCSANAASTLIAGEAVRDSTGLGR